MTPGLIQRHFDYVLGPNQDPRLALLTPGQSLSCVLGLDSDAPFLLRSRAVRVRYNTARQQTGLQGILARWSAPNRVFQSQDLIRQVLIGPYAGQIGNPMPVSPEVFYPRQAAINVDIKNDGAAELANVTFYFRGVKLFGPGAVKSYTYPAKFGLLPFVYPQGTYSDTDGLILVRQLPVNTGPIRYIFRCKPDADFVLRGGQAGDFELSANSTNEVFFQLKDEDEKPYSNDLVHSDILFGNSGFEPTFLNGAFPTVGGGPNSPGLFYPEIYIPKNHVIYFDISRNDAYVGGAVPVDYPISFIGQKVFEK